MDGDTYLQRQIALKLDYNTPYYGRLGDVVHEETDMDNFPFNRFFVSRYDSLTPSVFDRKAGYRVLDNAAYACHVPKTCRPKNPDLCFAAAATTVYPCRPTYFYEYASTEARDKALNRSCINTST